MEAKNIEALTFLIRQNNINSRKTNQDKKCMDIDDDIYYIYMAGSKHFQKNFANRQKTLTETTKKTLFTIQKERIYVSIENQLKKC